MIKLEEVAQSRDNTFNLIRAVAATAVLDSHAYPTSLRLRSASEGSIWTLLYEVLCSMGVFVVGILGMLQRPKVMCAVFAAFLAVSLSLQAFDISLHPKLNHLSKLALPFAVGMAFYIWRAWVPLTIWGVLALAALTWLWGPMSPVENIALSLPLVLLLSVLSWHLVEKPALDARGRVAASFAPASAAKDTAGRSRSRFHG